MRPDIRPADLPIAKVIEAQLRAFHKVHPLKGISTRTRLDNLVAQIIDSIRRIKYITLIRDKTIDQTCTDPNSNAFDPLKAAVWYMRKGNYDEAFWLVFLSIHFGKDKSTKWGLVKGIYGCLNQGACWTWGNISTHQSEFQTWFKKNIETLKNCGEFGGHRRENINDTGTTLARYISWVGNSRSHHSMIDSAQKIAGVNPRSLFDYLFVNMRVFRFGRLAKFDFLSMLGKLGLVSIEPGNTYLVGASGPLPGARLLFGGSKNSLIDEGTLEMWLKELEAQLGLHFGMQVLEDALCNWQKNPDRYQYFGG